MEKNVYLFVCPNLADWEPALAITMISRLYREIPKRRSYNIVTLGLSKMPVTTFGGVTILPDVDITEFDLEKTAMVILPGSSIYEKDDPLPLIPLIRDCINNSIPVAAICGGTLFLAKHGFLDTVRHTSGGPEWLKKHAPNYRGEGLYIHSPSVIDRGIITANTVGFIEFAYNIFKALEIFSPEFLEWWLDTFKAGYLDVDSLGRTEFG